jgi:hypothetical protein
MPPPTTGKRPHGLPLAAQAPSTQATLGRSEDVLPIKPALGPHISVEGEDGADYDDEDDWRQRAQGLEQFHPPHPPPVAKSRRSLPMVTASYSELLCCSTGSCRKTMMVESSA